MWSVEVYVGAVVSGFFFFLIWWYWKYDNFFSNFFWKCQIYIFLKKIPQIFFPKKNNVLEIKTLGKVILNNNGSWIKKGYNNKKERKSLQLFLL
jgi:hypothetical protein